MLFSLILGILLGVVAVVFIAQNVMLVTVTLFTWQMQGSLAVILFLALLTGVLITLLVLLPSFIRDAFSVAVLQTQKKELEDQLATTKHQLVDATARIAQLETPPPPSGML